MENQRVIEMLVGYRTLGQFIHADTSEATQERARVLYDAIDSWMHPEHVSLTTHIPAAKALLQAVMCNPSGGDIDSEYTQAAINMYVEVINDCIEGLDEIPF